MTETRHDLGVHGADDVHRMLDRWAHAGLIDDSTNFDASVQAIVDVVRSVRTGRPVTATYPQ